MTAAAARPSLLRWSRWTAAWWAIVLGGVTVLAVAIWQLRLEDLRQMGPAFWLVAALIVVGELRPVVASGQWDPEGVNLSTTFVFAVLLRWGLAPAVLTMAVATLVAETARRKEFWRTGFNVGQYVLCFTAVWFVLKNLGIHSTPSVPLSLEPGLLPAILAGAVIYYLVNNVLVSMILSLHGGSSFADSFFEDFAYHVTTIFAVLSLSPLVVVVMEKGAPLVPLLLPPLFAVYKTASMSLEKEHQALHDPLTGLPNRKMLVANSHDALDAAMASGHPAALFILDLDRFKEVNDTLGHQTGDRLLELVATRIQSATRPGDLVARLGGDEFAVLLPRVGDAAAAVEVANRINQSLDEPFTQDGMLLDLEASIGIALYPQHGRDVESLMRRADVAMYQAKESQSGVEVYAVERDRHSASRLGLLGELRRGMDLGELELHYQPKATLIDGAVVGVEGLVRWRHPERGLLLPDEFLPLAEHSGLMRVLTSTVLDIALTQSAAWRREGIDVQVAVNISVGDLTDGAFAGGLADGLRLHRLPPTAIQLEITEHVLMADPTRVTTTLSALDLLGVSLSLDDFGTGYSSLVHLKRLPVAELKIDRSFVNRMAIDEDDAVIVRSIIELAHALKLIAVAEGVETLETWRMLQEMGCDEAQGWLLSRPMHPDDATEWLRARTGRRRELHVVYDAS